MTGTNTPTEFEQAADQLQAQTNRLRALAVERLDLTNEIKDRQERITEIDEVLLQHRDEILHILPGWAFRVTERKTLDKKALEAAYPQATYPALYKTDLDTAAVKKAFAPEALEAFQKISAPYVTAKAAK